jgi:hypothetical protein
MFFLAAAGAVPTPTPLVNAIQNEAQKGIDPTSIANLIQTFLPLKALAETVDQVMWIMNLIGLCLIIIATVQEIPKTQGGEFFNVILRAIIALAVMAIITPLMWSGEVLVQNLVSDITTAAANNAAAGTTAAAGTNITNFVQNVQPFTGFTSAQADTRAQILYDFNWTAMFNALQPPPAPTNVFDFGGDATWLLYLLILGSLLWISLFVIFVMTLMLYVQKAILIFGLLLMPPFIGLQTWQGSARFLGVHYIQSMLGVLCWPIGWGLIYVGTAAAMQNLQVLFQQFSNNNNNIVLLIFIFVNFLLICLWMITGTIMAPGLMNKVITAGGNFAASAMGAVSGKAIGAPGDAIKGAAAAAGAVVGAAVAGPGGAQVGSQLGGSVGAVAAAPGDSARNSITQATGEGGGGAAPSGASFDAGLAALAQTGK